MHNVMESPGTEAPQWIRAFEAKYQGKGDFTKADWDKLLGKYQATCDLPVALFSVELAEVYPEAKVIILNRDPEAWYKSVLETIYVRIQGRGNLVKMLYAMILTPGPRYMKRFGQLMGGVAMGYDHGKQKDRAIEWFNEQYDGFRTRIPKDRYIEMTIKDGWAPLCAHLGVPIPMVKDEATGLMVEAPFPRVNETKSFHDTADKIMSNTLARANQALFVRIGKLTVTAAVGYAGFWLWKTRLGGRI